MLPLANASHARVSPTRSLVERVREGIAGLGCDRVWARNAGSHVVLGVADEEPFARVTPLGGASYGLAFPDDSNGARSASEPMIRWQMLLVDTLPDVVEHALVAIDAIDVSGNAEA